MSSIFSPFYCLAVRSHPSSAYTIHKKYKCPFNLLKLEIHPETNALIELTKKLVSLMIRFL